MLMMIIIIITIIIIIDVNVKCQGPSMMDFFVRESRAVVSGPMAIIRSH
jgi:hypothetical protein